MGKTTLLVIVGAVFLAVAIALNSLIDWNNRSRDNRPLPPPVASTPELSAPQLARQPVAPSFDVVRISPTGDTVIAGRAAPGAEVIIMDGETVIGRVTADQRGEWVLVPDKPLAPGARVFSLESKLPNGNAVKSESEVVLVVPDSAGAGALALRVPGAAAGPNTLLQSPFAGSNSSGLAIGVIDYDETGRATVSGKAKANARMNIYLDDILAGTAQADGRGEWHMSLSMPIAPGEHRLRVDETGADGKVVSRAEHAFARKTPVAGQDPTGGAIVVESGNSLWRLARRTYGEGLRYTLILEANREQIKDPDLIYPGQVFDLPRRP